MPTFRDWCAALVVGLAALTDLPTCRPADLQAQTPRNVSPRFARALQRPDTTVVAWVLARSTTDLDQLAVQITMRGGRVRRTSRLVRGVSAEMPASALRELARLPGVTRLQPVGTFYRTVRRSDGQAVSEPVVLPTYRPTDLPTPPRPPSPIDSLYGSNLWIANQLNLQELHVRGLRGAGVRIAILDAGFNTQHPLMAGATIVAQRDFVYNDSIVRDQPGEQPGEMAHGTATWSLIAARGTGLLYGVAPDAEFLLAKTEFTATETRTEEDNWIAAVEWALGLGAQIISSSLGYLSFDGGFSYSGNQLNGDFAVTTIAADSAAARGVLVVVSVGNDGAGPQTLGTPADGDSVIAVGATDSLGRIASFSSRGPTTDGRIKPDVVAPGVAVTVAAMDSGTTRSNGTSFATPLIAGLAALVQGVRTGPAIELREGLLQASSRFGAPDNTFGYGIPNGLAFYAFPRGVRLLGPGPGFLGTVTPTFSWFTGPPPIGAGTNLYFLRVYADSMLRVKLLDTSLTSTSFTLARPLRPATTVYWRVAAGSTAAIAESTTVQGPLIAPPWAEMVTLGSPQGATIRDSLPLFVWQSPGAAQPPGPFGYDVDVYPASRTPLQAVASGRGLSDTTFQPATPLEKNLPFRWRIVARLGSDSVITTSPGTFLVADASTPTATVLFQNFPNPFPNPSTGLTTSCIWFDIAQAGAVRLEVFDIRGRLVRRLAPSSGVPSQLPPGRYGRPAGDAPGTCDPRFAWDGRDETGQFARAGVYIYRLTAPGFQDSKRIVFAGRP